MARYASSIITAILLCGCGSSTFGVPANNSPNMLAYQRVFHPSWYGTVFAVSPAGGERVLYRFLPRDGGGILPQAGLVAVSGELYGTTVWGGGVHCGYSFNWGCGTVFEVTPAGHSGALYNFEGSPSDGSFPLAGSSRFAAGFTERRRWVAQKIAESFSRWG